MQYDESNARRLKIKKTARHHGCGENCRKHSSRGGATVIADRTWGGATSSMERRSRNDVVPADRPRQGYVRQPLRSLRRSNYYSRIELLAKRSYEVVMDADDSGQGRKANFVGFPLVRPRCIAGPFGRVVAAQCFIIDDASRCRPDAGPSTFLFPFFFP